MRGAIVIFTRVYAISCQVTTSDPLVDVCPYSPIAR